MLNVCIFTGNLTRDPELRFTAGGSAVANVAVAVNERFKSNGENQTRTFFANCVFWAKQAEFLNEHFKKGDPITVEGSAREETWETNEGDKRSRVVFSINKIHFVPKGGGSKSETSGTSGTSEEKSETKETKTEKTGVPF